MFKTSFAHVSLALAFSVSASAAHAQYNTWSFPLDKVNVVVPEWSNLPVGVLSNDFSTGGVNWYGSDYESLYNTDTWYSDNSIYWSNGRYALDLDASYSNSPSHGRVNFNTGGLRFEAKSGYTITGYRLSISGYANTSVAGPLTISGDMAGVNFAAEVLASNLDSSSFNWSVDVASTRNEVGGGIFTAELSAVPSLSSYFPGDPAYLMISNVSVKALVSPIAVSSVPEPYSVWLALGGLGLISCMARRKS